MDVLIVSWNGVKDVGGVERVTYYLSQAMKENANVVVISLDELRRGAAKFFLGIHPAIDAIIVSVYVKSIIKTMLGSGKKREDIKVISQGFNAPFVKADIAFAHGTMRQYKMNVFSDNRWRVNQIYEKIAFKNAGLVAAVANHVKEELYELYDVPLEKIHVIHNAIDTEKFKPEYEKKDDAIHIIFVGRLEKRKGVEKLLELAEYIEKADNLFLHIATPDRNGADAFSGLSRTTITCGIDRESMVKFYNEGDVMFLPSLYEGFEMVTIECLSCGVPVIGNSVGAIGDLFQWGNNGVAILSGEMEKDIKSIRTLANYYRIRENKTKLHDDISKEFGLARYYKQVNALLGF